MKFADLLAHPVCRMLRSIATDAPCHLVGGALRDAALGCRPRDFDVVVAGAGRRFARRLAALQKGRAVDLGGDRFAAYRVVAGDSVVDIWDRDESPLHQDLERRDFTIHSFALDVRSGGLTDPFDGLGDLARRLLRATTPNSFVDDPLRVLRLCRFANQLPDWRLEKRTETLAERAAPRLPAVASERVRCELELILAAPRASRAAALLARLGLYPQMWLGHHRGDESPAPPSTKLLAAFRRVDDPTPGVITPNELYCARMALLFALSPGDRRSHLEAIDAFRAAGLLTRANARQVAALTACSALPRKTPEQRWFLHCLGPLWPTAVLFLLARDIADTAESSEAAAAAIRSLAKDSAAEIFQPRPLLTGEDLQRSLGLEPGAELGRILGSVRRSQIEGVIETRRQALQLARELAKEGCTNH